MKRSRTTAICAAVNVIRTPKLNRLARITDERPTASLTIRSPQATEVVVMIDAGASPSEVYAAAVRETHATYLQEEPVS